ncbi:hypothetical protein [Patiriisocius hiemis]|uniref:Tetratricopeptide repeat protein n=1 Tax=Patiriisocius hiemis TaxID=3075604 RepID=A0ABU2YB21_9FLAO|nr:hypothetical protein [Constantimarinum sp. W242]MDT0555391.1 hypothetical protein [Constantimarinum sp. W242]
MDREQLIQGYIEGTLTSTQQEEATKLLANDAAFKEEVSLYKDLQAAITDSERRTLKTSLQELENKTPALKKRSNFYLIAASIVVVLGIGSLFMFSSPNPEQLYASNFEVYPNTLKPVVRGDVGEEMLPFIAYETKEYDKAVVSFASILEQNDDPDIRFYYAMSLLNDSQETKALQELKVLESSNTKYLPQVYWYTALLELKKENIEASKTLLNRLIEDKALYKNREAKQLLKKLD